MALAISSYHFSTRGPSETKPAKEDRLILIHDLLRYVRNRPYDNARYGDSILIDNDKVAANAKTVMASSTKVSLFAVLDGHAGTFAADYVVSRLPYEIVSNPKFPVGDWENVMKTSIRAIHDSMLAASKYLPEIGAFCSGTTLSAVLITPTQICSALLGDSPIFFLKKSTPNPIAPHDLHDHLNPKECQRIEASNSLLLQHLGKEQYLLSWHPQERRELLQYSNPRVGLAGVNVFGTLGDSIAEPQIYNALLRAAADFKSSPEFSASLLLPPDEQYEKVASFLSSHPALSSPPLSAAFSLPLSFSSSPVTLRLFFDLLLRIGEENSLSLQGCPLRRIPETKLEETKDVEKILIASDGCISTRVVSGSPDSTYLRAIFEQSEMTSQNLRSYLQSFPSCNRLDDMSGILLHINPPKAWGLRELIFVFVCVVFLIAWFFGGKVLTAWEGQGGRVTLD